MRRTINTYGLDELKIVAGRLPSTNREPAFSAMYFAVSLRQTAAYEVRSLVAVAPHGHHPKKSGNSYGSPKGAVLGIFEAGVRRRFWLVCLQEAGLCLHRCAA